MNYGESRDQLKVIKRALKIFAVTLNEFPQLEEFVTGFVVTPDELTELFCLYT